LLEIAICESDISQVEELEQLIVKSLFDEELNIDIYDNGEEMIKAFSDDGFRYDMIFLDTDLKKVCGFDVAAAIRKKDISSELIFISEDRLKVFDAFKYNAFDFLVKPIDYDGLFDALERFKLYHDDGSEEYFTFRISSTENKVKLKSILYFCSFGRKVIIVTPKQKFEFYSKLDDIEKTVDSTRFIRVHQSYYVNSRYIKFLTKNDIVLENDEYIPISRQRQKSIREEYIKLLSDT